MIDQTRTPAVEAIIHEALAKTTPAHLLAEAVRRTSKGTSWKGRKKLSREEALAATRVVTRLVQRHGLRPTKVLQREGRASTREQTYRFFLTEEEMATGTVAADRSLSMSIGAHVDNVRAIATAARSAGNDIDEDAMMAELAEAVAGFLDQFRDVSDADEELAEDVTRIASWLGRPSRRFELARYLADVERLDLDYDPATGGMTSVGPDVSRYVHGGMPWVPVRTRPVASGDCVVYRQDEAERVAEEVAFKERRLLFNFNPKLHEVGRERAFVCEKVGLGVVLDRGKGLRMTFTVDHVTYASMAFARDGGIGKPGVLGYLECRGIPRLGKPEKATDGLHYVEVASNASSWCPDFHAYATEVLGEDSPIPSWEAPLARRFLPVTAETCRLLLDGGYRDALIAAPHFYDVKDETVLPECALTDEGVESWSIRDRFAELLYSRGAGSLAGLLEAEATKRAQAYEAYLLRSASGARKRKMEFRAWMRS